MKLKYYFLFITLFAFGACSVPMNSFNNVGKSIDMNKKSGISVVASVESSTSGIARQLENIIPDTIVQGNYEDYDLDYEVYKQGNLDLKLDGRLLNIKAPLRVSMKKSMLFGEATADGIIQLNVESEYNVSPEWKIDANSKLLGHEWLEKPVLKFGIIKIPIESMTNFMINQIEDNLLSELDRALAEQIQISKEIKKMQDYVLNEFQYEYEGKFLAFVPKEMKASGFRSNNDELRVQLGMTGNLEIADERLKTDMMDTIAYSPMVFNGSLNHSKARVMIAEKDIQELSALYMDQNPIDMGDGREIYLKDTRFSLEDGKLEVASDASGFIEGPVYVKGKLEFNEGRNEVAINGFELKANIKGVFKRMGISLVKKRIKDEIEKSLNEFIWEYVNEYNKFISDWSSDVKDDYPISWNASGLEISLQDIEFEDDTLSLIFNSKENLKLLFKE